MAVLQEYKDYCFVCKREGIKPLTLTDFVSMLHIEVHFETFYSN